MKDKGHSGDFILKLVHTEPLVIWQLQFLFLLELAPVMGSCSTSGLILPVGCDSLYSLSSLVLGIAICLVASIL